MGMNSTEMAKHLLNEFQKLKDDNGAINSQHFLDALTMLTANAFILTIPDLLKIANAQTNNAYQKEDFINRLLNSFLESIKKPILEAFKNH